MDNLNDESESEKDRNRNEKCILLFTCSYCGKKLNTLNINEDDNSSSGYEKDNIFYQNMANDYICSGCNKTYLKKCSVCLCAIKINKNYNSGCIIFCTKCSHGGHYEHYKEWFTYLNECPNSKCDCRCQEEGYKNLMSS